MRSLLTNQATLPHPADRAITRDNLLLVGVASLLCGVFAAIHTIYLTVIIHTPVLVFDEWRVLARYIEFMAGRLSLPSFLWEDYQGHRNVVPRLLFILDAKTVGGTQVLTETISLSLWLFLVALFAILHLRQWQMSWGIRLIGVGLLVLVLLPNQQIYNFGIGWNGAIVVNVLFSVLALYLLIKSIEKTVNRKRAFALLACALLSAVLSTFSMANGLLIWPIMLLVCARFRAWPWAIIVAIVGAVIVTTYLLDYQHTGLFLDALEHPKELAYFFVTLLGYPALGPLGTGGATLFGVLGILLVVYLFFRQNWRIDHDTPNVCFLLAICLFVIATAGMISLARFGLGIEQALVPRYYSFVTPLWAAILLLGFILHKQNTEKIHRSAWVLLDACVLLVAIWICGSAYIKGPDADLLKVHLYDDRERGATAIVAGAPDRIALENIYPPSDINILSLVPYLASNRLSVFHSNVDYFLYQKAHKALHKPLSDGMSLDGEWCAGAIENTNKLDVGRASSAWYKISGWSLDRKNDRNADGVIFSDEDGHIVGIGRMSFADLQIAKEFNGYAKMNSSRSVVAYAYKADRHNLCRFGETKVR